MARKKRGDNLCGVVLLDKPRGLSSNQALQRVRWLLGAQKAGHGGALDPMAEGVLPILLGDAARLSDWALNGDKGYEFTIQFGAETDTGDAEGQVVRESATLPDESVLHAVIPQFLGAQTQVPPMYSALKRDGQPLYKLARKGETVDRDARHIEVHSLDLLHVDGAQARFATTVSKGTYIRTLAEDMARALGSAGHLVYLRRTHASGMLGPLVRIEDIEAYPLDERRTLMLAVDRLVPGLLRVVVSDSDVARLRHGQPAEEAVVPTSANTDDSRALLLNEALHVVALGQLRDGQWWPQKVFAADAWQQSCQGL